MQMCSKMFPPITKRFQITPRRIEGQKEPNYEQNVHLPCFNTVFHQQNAIYLVKFRFIVRRVYIEKHFSEHLMRISYLL